MMSHAFPGRGVKCYFNLAALPLLLRNYYIKNSRGPRFLTEVVYLPVLFTLLFSLFPLFFSLSPMMSQNPRLSVAPKLSKKKDLKKYTQPNTVSRNSCSQTLIHLLSPRLISAPTKSKTYSPKVTIRRLPKVLKGS